MTMNKTLIVYGTRKGTTTETVSIIADVLRSDFNHEVECCESSQLRSYKRRLNEYNTIIIGSSIVSGRWKSSILSFARKDLFKDKKVALFVTAGGTLNKVQKYGITKPEAVNEAIQHYIDKYLNKFKFTPISKGAFGGKVIKREVIRYNSWDKSDIIDWTSELGNKFNQLSPINN
jgi:menaquinone-dependent protoporphyrinogen IX oxidase